MKPPIFGQRKKTVGLLLAASFCIVIALAVVSFAFRLKNVIDERTNYILNNSVQQYGESFIERIEGKLSAASTVADIIANVDGEDITQIYSVLGKLAKKENFCLTAISDKEGNTITNRGDKLNMAQQDYFIRASRGETTVSDAVKSPVDNTRVLMISVPINVGNGIVGVLSCGYELSELEELTAKPRYFGEAYGMIFSPKGDVISWEQHKNSLAGSQNMKQIFENCKMFGDMSYEKLNENIANRRCGTFSIEYMGEMRLVSYTPLDLNDWYAFCFAPFTIYNRETAEFGKIVTLLVIELMLALTILLCYVIYNNHSHSKLMGAANLKYEAIISNICGGVVVTTWGNNLEDRELVYVSAGFTGITGYTLEDFKSKWNGKLYHHIYEKDRAAVDCALHAITEGRKEYDVEYRIVHSDGHIVWVMDRGKIIDNEEGLRQCQSVLTDISVMKEQQEQLAISEERFRIAIESADNIMFDYDCINCAYVDFANSVHMLGKTTNEINADLKYTHTLSEIERTTEIVKYFYHPDDWEAVFEQSRVGLETGEAYFDARVRCADDKYIWCRIHLTVINDVDGVPYHILGFMGNIDVIKRQSELFRIKSEKDALTGFYNKAATVSLINDALSNASVIPQTLFAMDIDNFKTINDTLGHIAGDAVIAEAAERIRTIFRSEDILGRIGGDEFVVLIRGVSDTEHIIRKATEIIEAFNTMSVNAGGFFSVSISIGIEICTEAGNYEESFIRADKALYKAKRCGKNKYVFFEASMNALSCYTCNEAATAQNVNPED